jgi:hypothetical protein
MPAKIDATRRNSVIQRSLLLDWGAGAKTAVEAMKKGKRIIDGTELELSEWLEVISKPPPGCSVVDYKFPTDVHLDEYIRSIGQRSE